MSDRQRDSSFLNRWSARKRQNEQTDSAPVDDDPAVDLPASDDLASGEQADSSSRQDALSIANQSEPDALDQAQTDAPLLTDADMPAIESLSSDSDLSGFFSKGVSKALKRAALRHVFQQPQFNVRDGLNDYDGDYTVFEPLGDTVTSDMKWHIARKERERLEAEARELELQERLELERQASEDDEQKPEESNEPEATEDDVEVLEADNDNVIAAEDEEGLSEKESVFEHDDAALLESAESVLGGVDRQELQPGRVAGKLKRADRKDLQNNNKTLKVTDVKQGNNENAQEYEE